MERQLWERTAGYVGCSLAGYQHDRLLLFQDWLREEAAPAGAIGPSETGRIATRHIADSLLFRIGLDPDAPEVWDLGSGAGLPGIPLAILLPETELVLIERSGRRAGLLRRALRILGVENATVLNEDVTRLEGATSALVARALWPPGRLLPLVERHLDAPGTAVVGGSWTERPEHRGWETHHVPEEILDQPVWLLIMRRG